MGADVVGLDRVAVAEICHEGLGGGDLLGGGGGLIEVAHEADPDPVLVDVGGLAVPAMHAVLLVQPAVGDLDLAIRAVRPVADHEVVAAPLEAENLAVVAVDLVQTPLAQQALW